MDNALRLFILAAQLTAITLLRGAEPDIQFLESSQGAGSSGVQTERCSYL